MYNNKKQNNTRNDTPKENTKNIYDSFILLRLFSADKNIIQKKAEHCGMNVSEYIRHSALNRKITSKSDLELVAQIRKIGININQAVKKINSLSDKENNNEIIKELLQFNEKILIILSNI